MIRKQTIIRRRLMLGALIAVGIGLAGRADAQAQDWPNRPVRMVVAYPAGGSTDVAARLLADRFSRLWGQQVVVENKGGAAGAIGADAVAKAAPDGYTILAAASPEIAIIRSTRRDLPYDPLRDFQPISLVARTPFMLVVHPSVPAGSVKELIALAKSKPGTLNFASFGVGTSNHLMGELFKATAGIDLVHVPYRGSAPAMTDLIAGQVQMAFDTITASLPHVREGRLKPIATTMPSRSPLAPEVPTVVESGLPDLVGGTWIGLLAPGGTPLPIVEKVSKTTAEVMRGGLEVSFVERGFQPVGSSPAEFAAFIDAEVGKWSKVIETAGIKPE